MSVLQIIIGVIIVATIAMFFIDPADWLDTLNALVWQCATFSWVRTADRLRRE